MSDMTPGMQEQNSSPIGTQTTQRIKKLMSRGVITKPLMVAKVLKLKYDLFSSKYSKFSQEQKASADEMLNEVLFILDEYTF